MRSNQYQGILRPFFVVNYLLVVLLILYRFPVVQLADARTTLFTLCALFSQAFLCLLPALLLVGVVAALFRLLRPGFGGGWPVQLVALCASSLTLILLYADSFIYQLYQFHLNGFVWNLLMTPGGIESLGGSRGTYLSILLIVGAVLAGEALLLLVLRQLAGRRSPLIAGLRIPLRALLVFLLLATAGDRLIYGISQIQAHPPVLQSANHLPFYMPMTFRKLAKKLGVEVKRSEGFTYEDAGRQLNYPLQPLQVEPPEKPLNLLMIVVESLRADMLSAEIMPNSARLAADSYHFTQHYSGGNATRMGVFSMFYGLYGPYWFKFLDQQRSPVLIDTLQQQDYRFGVFTSQKITYPEFDKTVFANLPLELMQQNVDGPGYLRDRTTVDQLKGFLREQQPDKPFFAYLFLEAPHAPYTFAEETALRTPYLEDLNYLKMRLDKDVELIRNRYINASHYSDLLLGEIYRQLEQSGQLENTLVLVTGDHGEEFLDTGRWGHNNAFTDAQTMVPLILAVPGHAPRRIDRLTSHLDIPATLLPFLGVSNPPGDYSLGYDMLGDQVRQYTMAADWSRLGYIDAEFKANIPLKAGSHLFDDAVTTRDDQPYPDAQHFFQSRQSTILSVMRNLSVFSSKN
ncbi:MAG: sulfatase-like hydrolase/transferase [Desulfuromonadales bacterium]|nr:sulfatase-like hydrolase/transferase [Desulfuromonadales bacterium]